MNTRTPQQAMARPPTSTGEMVSFVFVLLLICVALGAIYWYCFINPPVESAPLQSELQPSSEYGVGPGEGSRQVRPSEPATEGRTTCTRVLVTDNVGNLIGERCV